MVSAEIRQKTSIRVVNSSVSFHTRASFANQWGAQSTYRVKCTILRNSLHSLECFERFFKQLSHVTSTEHRLLWYESSMIQIQSFVVLVFPKECIILLKCESVCCLV